MQNLRTKLQMESNDYFDLFISFQKQICPILDTTMQLFPDFTRHDSTHIVKLESIICDIIAPVAFNKMSVGDVLILLCSLWLHDAGMANLPVLRKKYQNNSDFRSLLLAYRRRGLSEDTAWKDFIRQNHHNLCEDVLTSCISTNLPKEIAYWVHTISRSHGEGNLHDREKWPSEIAISDNQRIHPPILACLLRISDIIHFNSQRAPEYLLEHRRIANFISIMHWRAHQVCADFTIENDTCFLDGVTDDDEAYWFAQQFIIAMNEEVKYCQQYVFPIQPVPFDQTLKFTRVESRIRPHKFYVEKSPITLKVETDRFLSDLLNDALYANKPTWFRELIQNCFDACRDIQALHNEASPSVIIRFDSKTGVIEFEDNGIGMKPSTVQNYLLVAGASYWNSSEYIGSRDLKSGHVGKFGIGFMSVFGIASAVNVFTRHIDDSNAWLFEIRNPKSVIKMSQVDRIKSGTTIQIKVKHTHLFTFDITKLFNNYCPFPEFPVTIEIDGKIAISNAKGAVPRIETSGFILFEKGKSKTKAILLRENLNETGFTGDFYLPKIKIESLDGFVPGHFQHIHGAGWDFQGSSAIFYGGVKYPQLHALNGKVGFTHIPSIGALRIAVSPNDYLLEMNLAREQFMSGPGTTKLFRDLCFALDKIIASDIRQECKGKDPLSKSTITALYSEAMMNLWLGHVHHLTHICMADNICNDECEETPWPESMKCLRDNLIFTISDLTGKTTQVTLQDLINSSATIFSLGALPHGISNHLINEITKFDQSAKLLFALPHPEFGMKELQHWAQEEYLVPVIGHRRSSIGLRLAKDKRPFCFFPRETDKFGLPIASGPINFAFLDYRDHMAEAGGSFSGGPDIIAVLNRRNEKVIMILNILSSYPTKQDLLKIATTEVLELRDAMKIGRENRYFPTSNLKLLNAINSFCLKVNTDRKNNVSIIFVEEDLPPYFKGGEVLPFGNFLLDKSTIAALKEKQEYGNIGTRIVMA